AKFNPVIGGVLFTAALVVGGMGFLNLVGRVDVTPAMRMAVIALGGGAVLLTVSQAFRGDAAARMIFPGVALMAAAPLVGPMVGVDAAAFTLAPHGLFTVGVLAASFVAITEAAGIARSHATMHAMDGTGEQHFASSHHFQNSHRKGPARIETNSQLARVLDYAGVGILDWNFDDVEQTEMLPELLGADSSAPFTPEALREFIHEDDLAAFESNIVAPTDGKFDVPIKLFDGRTVRMRGVRASDVDETVLERLVLFVEGAPSHAMPTKNNGVDGATVQKATAAAIVPASIGADGARFIDALDNGDIVAAFQPIVELGGKKQIVGYEALARWRDQKDGNDEGPETFVRTANAVGKGAELTNLMLAQSAAHLAERIEAGESKDAFVAMNVSWNQMRDKDFAKMVARTIKEYSLPKKSMVIELTEGDAVTDDVEASRVFKSLRDAGAALAFDDFGAGFSCLSNLRKYDFDFLKVDKSYANDLASGGDGAKIVGALAGLGNDLGLKVIVEGIENKKSADAALKLGCTYGQGYALGKPIQQSCKKENKILFGRRAKANIDNSETLALRAEEKIDEISQNMDEAVIELSNPEPPNDDVVTETIAENSDEAAHASRKGSSWLWRRSGLR
ncbi:MAG: EAL domain-containing protein, partial [Marinicaulis sp.]|nr:EAL domain-containing protein [Marinicaulis sp.]